MHPGQAVLTEAVVVVGDEEVRGAVVAALICPGDVGETRAGHGDRPGMRAWRQGCQKNEACPRLRTETPGLSRPPEIG